MSTETKAATGAASITVTGIFVGSPRPLPPEGQITGLYKSRAPGPVTVGTEGIVGDFQGDRRVHGGPEKALHHYAAANYARLADAFPAIATEFVPGALGENLSSDRLDEATVCIGDVYRIGGCRVQVSQPRSPCWKINHRFDNPKLSRFVERERLTGWYYRVLEGGVLGEGDAIELLERADVAVSIADFVEQTRRHRPEPGTLRRLADLAGLAPGWVERLRQRSDYLRGREKA